MTSILDKLRPQPDVQEAITAVWERHPDEEYRQSQSHWRGKGRWADDKTWQGPGRRTVERLDLACKMLGRELTSPRVLEWGPGGGSLAYAFRERAHRYYGVDISQRNLEECGRVIHQSGHPGVFVPIHLAGEPGTIRDSVKDIDVFLSNACFQHFPSKDYGRNVLRAARGVCRDSAVGVVQIRYDTGRRLYRGISRISQYAKRHIVATSYRLEEFWSLLLETGWQPLCIQHLRQENQEAYFLITARPTSP